MKTLKFLFKNQVFSSIDYIQENFSDGNTKIFDSSDFS